MALEIERKFLVTSDEWQRLGTPQLVRQGYLSRDIERTVRVRIKGDKAYLTIKGRNKGAIRTEFEYAIPTDEAAVRSLKRPAPRLRMRARSGRSTVSSVKTKV